MLILFFSSLLVGLALGLLGAGGSVVTVPVLVYLLGHSLRESIAESMAIVGLISLVTAIPYARAKSIDWKSVWWFGLPGVVGTLIGAWYGVIASETLQFLVLGGVFFLAAVVMMRTPRETMNPTDEPPQYRSPLWRIVLDGTLVGIVTGFVGVGGGFLIVPALVVLGKLPMRLAIGTSLAIIAIKAAIGFAKYEHYLLSHDLSANSETIMVFALIGIVGSYLGRLINAQLDQHRLRQVFAAFLILLGSFVLFSEMRGLFDVSSTSVT